MQAKACGQGKTLPHKDEAPWDEKLPGFVDKGQHDALGSIGSRPTL